LAGSVPAGVPADLYATWIPAFREHGVRVILDSSGPSLAAGAAMLPWALKPNREELETLAALARAGSSRLGAELTLAHVHPEGRRAAAAAVARGWVDRGIGLVVASLGAEGAIAADRTGVWYAAPLEIPVVNPAGAGDAMVAAIAMAASQDPPTVEVLRSAVALASAVVLTEGTAECHRADYERLFPRVRVDSLPV
jgi:fructose-1-phosphate kinase PfkB-like protein